MVLGDVVTRNPRYVHCICGKRPCWCRAGGDWKVTDVKLQQSSQSGYMMRFSQGSNETDWIDSSHFLLKAQGELFK